MIISVLTPVDTASQIDRALNSYLYNLVSLEKVVVPSLPMAAHAALADADKAEMGAMFYHLTTLTTSLNQLAGCLLAAHEELEIFVSEGANLEWFAQHKQREAVYTASRARRKPSNWQVKYQSLAPFQLHAVLARYFAGSPGGGERIGTSQPVDFSYHSDLLRNGLTFGLRDPGQPAIPSNLTTRRPDERIGLPIEQPDERWAGYDVSLSGPEAVTRFELLLHQCRQAADFYHNLAADDTAGHCKLYELLQSMLDGPETT